MGGDLNLLYQVRVKTQRLLFKTFQNKMQITTVKKRRFIVHRLNFNLYLVFVLNFDSLLCVISCTGTETQTRTTQ